jgi:uncharacterized protein YjeT (DUF2065 family)
VRNGNKQISLATEDMFIWGQVHTDTPFYFPNREALLDLYSDIVDTPGVEQHVLSHATIAPAVVDPVLIRKLSERLLDKSPIRLPTLSTHPRRRAMVPLIGLETGSVRMAKQIVPSKGVPFRPLMMFAGVAPERLLRRFGRLHVGRPLTIRSRKELLATIKPHQWRHLRADIGDLPDEFTAPPPARGGTFIRLTPPQVA